MRGRSNLPIVVLLQGWGGVAADWSQSALDNIGRRGLFVCAPGLRGRDGADGSADAFGREVHDIYDALQYVRVQFGGIVSSDKAVLVGGSGGGGEVLAALCKFPDTFCLGVDYYGISDVGRNNPNGWYYNNDGSYGASIGERVGNIPANTPERYYARDATAAIQNYTGGRLIIFHDESDAVVPVVHSTRITAALDAAGLSNYEAHYSKSGDAVRWTHGHSWDSGVEYDAEEIWVPQIATATPWTIPATGTVTVIGYIVTKRFAIWLNSGLDAAATVAYSTTTGAYTVTPLTSADITVAITQGALTASGTATAGGATLFTVA